MAKRLEIHPEALEELATKAEWYQIRSARAAERLEEEVASALEAIVEAPRLFVRFDYGTRRARLRHFPISVVFRETKDHIHVYAFAHDARRPGYWQDRSF